MLEEILRRLTLLEQKVDAMLENSEEDFPELSIYSSITNKLICNYDNLPQNIIDMPGSYNYLIDHTRDNNIYVPAKDLSDLKILIKKYQEELFEGMDG